MNARTFLVMLLAGALAGGAAHELSGYLAPADPAQVTALNWSGGGDDTAEQSAALEQALLQ